MRRSVLASLMATTLVVVSSFAAPAASPAPAAPPVSLADLDWLAGRWVIEDKGQYLEETWSSPVNNSLTGMFRWNRDGKPGLCELMTISLDDAGQPVFRLRHFDATLTPKEKDAPLAFPLLKMEKNKVTWQDPSAPADRARLCIYSRTGDQLTVRLEKADGSGEDFKFTRVKGNDEDSGVGAMASSSPLGFTGGLVVKFNVTDRAKSRQWYHDTLGFEVLFEDEKIGWTEMINREAKLTIGLNQSPVANVSAGTTPVIGVRDLDAARKHLEAKSVSFTGDSVTHEGLVKLATLLDPDGHQLMLYQSLGD